MTTSLHSPISMQITLTPSDLTEARLLLPHQIRVWGNQVDDILVLVDLPPWRTRDAAAVQAQQELAGFLDRQRASEVDFARVTCPVYVVRTGRDELTPSRVVRSNAARYPQAALRHYPERGHWVLDDLDAEEMNTDIANWIQGQQQRATMAVRA